jgi:hypothetical protein
MWWEYVIIAAVLIFGVYAFLVMVGFQSRVLTRKTERSAESIYDNYADSERAQRRFARKHGDRRPDDARR